MKSLYNLHHYLEGKHFKVDVISKVYFVYAKRLLNLSRLFFASTQVESYMMPLLYCAYDIRS